MASNKHWMHKQTRRHKKKASYARSAKSTLAVTNQRLSPLSKTKLPKVVRALRSRRSTEPLYRPREPINGLRKNNPLAGIVGPFGVPRGKPSNRAVPNIFPNPVNFGVYGVSPYVAYGRGARTPEYTDLGGASIRKPTGIYGLPSMNPLFNR